TGGLGAVTNTYGLKVADQAFGTNRWAIKTGLGNIELNDDLFIFTSALAQPTAPVVTRQGTPGATSYSYYCVVNNHVGHTEISPATVTATGNATLNNTNWNNVVAPNPAGAVSVDIYRSASAGTPSKTGFIGNVAPGATLEDKGLPARLDAVDINTTKGTYLDSSVTIGEFIWALPETGQLFLGSLELFNAIAGLNTRRPLWLTNQPGDESLDMYLIANVNTGTGSGFAEIAFTLFRPGVNETAGDGDIFNIGAEGTIDATG